MTKSKENNLKSFEFHVDHATIHLRHPIDFGFLQCYGTAFIAFDQSDSGNLCLGFRNGAQKRFVKIAGAPTINASCSPNAAVNALKNALPLYETLRHDHLIHLTDHFAHEALYTAVFDWVDGDSLFDHWNFDAYAAAPGLCSPRDRFLLLPPSTKAKALDAALDFLAFAQEKGYAAVDFYDGSLIYDFARDRVTICDIDLFTPIPSVNRLGTSYPGSKRFKAPEEYQYGAPINVATTVFTGGALAFHFFGRYPDAAIETMYEDSAFHPCTREQWELSETSYQIALKATSPSPQNRFATIQEFAAAWRKSFSTP